MEDIFAEGIAEGVAQNLNANLSQLASAIASAQGYAQQALAAIGVQNTMLAAPATLPFEVTAVSAGMGTGAGGTPGLYALIPSNNMPGFQAFGTIDSTGKVSATNAYTVSNPGISATSVPVTLAWPANANFTTTPTAPTVTVGTVVVGRVFQAPDPTNSFLQLWQNSAGALTPYGSPQLSRPMIGPLPTPLESGWADVKLSLAKKFLYGVSAQGVFSANQQNQPAGSFSVNGALIDNLIWQPACLESGYIARIVDVNKHLVYGLTYPGCQIVTANGLGVTVPPAIAVDASYMADTIIDSSGNSQIRTHARANGTRTQITTTGNNLSPSLDPAGNVLFQRLPPGGAAFAEYWSPANGSKPIAPVLPTAVIDCNGDSVTAGNGSGTPWVTQLATATGRTINNYGIPGQTTVQIVARQGGLPTTLAATVSIPASGAVAVTPSPLLMSTQSDSNTRSMTGTLMGVHGTLTRTAGSSPGVNDTYAFTRDAAGTAVTALAGAQFLFDQGPAAAGDVQIIFGGTNDIFYQGSMTQSQVVAQILASYQAAAAYQTCYVGGRIWVSVLNRSTEPVGSANYVTVMAANAALAAAAPAAGAIFVDARGYIANGINGNTTTQAMLDLGLTPTSQDLIDIGNNVAPTQMRADTVHPNQAGNQAYERIFQATLTAAGF